MGTRIAYSVQQLITSWRIRGRTSIWARKFSFLYTRPATNQSVSALLPGKKRHVLGVDHPPPISAEVRERVQLYLYSPFCGCMPRQGKTFFYCSCAEKIFKKSNQVTNFLKIRTGGTEFFPCRRTDTTKQKSLLEILGKRQKIHINGNSWSASTLWGMLCQPNVSKLWSSFTILSNCNT